MIRFFVNLLASAGLIVAGTMPVQADDFQFTMKVDRKVSAVSAKAKANATKRPASRKDDSVSTKDTVETTSAKKPPSRPVVELIQDEAVRVSWHAKNTSQSETFKDVLVHFFVVQEKKTGQADVPKLTKDVTYEGALTADFKPGEDANWQWTLKIHDPGSYLLRVETIGMEKHHGHDHYAAMDLVVNDAKTGGNAK